MEEMKLRPLCPGVDAGTMGVQHQGTIGTASTSLADSRGKAPSEAADDAVFRS